MPVSEAQATMIVKKQFPKGDIRPPIDYRGLYVFQVFNSGVTDEDYDPFFSVNQRTGELRDFSIITDGNVREITALFLAKQKSR